MKLVHLTN